MRAATYLPSLLLARGQHRFEFQGRPMTECLMTSQRIIGGGEIHSVDACLPKIIRCEIAISDNPESSQRKLQRCLLSFRSRRWAIPTPMTVSAPSFSAAISARHRRSTCSSLETAVFSNEIARLLQEGRCNRSGPSQQFVRDFINAGEHEAWRKG
jgi:hypothetical protein